MKEMRKALRTDQSSILMFPLLFLLYEKKLEGTFEFVKMTLMQLGCFSCNDVIIDTVSPRLMGQ